MARKRACFAASVCCSDSFADLSSEAQALYYRLGFEADADGAIDNVRQVSRMTGFGGDAVAELVGAGLLIEVPPIHVVAHWWVNNKVDKSNYREGDHRLEIDAALEKDDCRVYRLVMGGAPDGSQQSAFNQTDGSLSSVVNTIQNNLTEFFGNESNPIESERNQDERKESGQPVPLTARCPECGSEVLVSEEMGRLHGWCPQDGDFFIEKEVR